MALTFYCGSGSPYAWKVWLVLEHKNIPYELRMLSFDKGETASAEFRAINPRAKVPAIVDGGNVVRESAVIAEYLEDRYPDKPLLPKDPVARARARRIAAEADSYLAAAMGRLFNLTLWAKSPATAGEIAEAQQQIQSELAVLEAELTGDFLVGSLSLADFTAFSQVRLLPRIDERMPGKGISRDRLPPKTAGWLKRIEALPYYEKTIPPHWKG